MRLALFGLLLLSLVGCDVLGRDSGTSARGVVVDAQTGEPLENIWVTLRSGGGFIGEPTVIASDSTAADGTFYVEESGGGAGRVLLYASKVVVPENGYLVEYLGFNKSISTGKDHVVRIELQPVD